MMILVTGATGNVGRQLVRHLAGHADVQVRMGVHHLEKVAGLTGGNIEAVYFDFYDEASIEAALRGVDHVYLLTPPVADGAEMARRALDVMKRRAIEHVVRQSVLNANREPTIALTRDHRAVECEIEASGIPWTFLRPNSFMENLYGFAESVRNEGTFYAPLAQGRVSYIAAQDIGAVAAEALTTPGHTGKAYDLTGPEAYSGEDIARALGEATGHTVRYVPISDDQMRQAFAGMPPERVESYVELWQSYRAGAAAVVSDVVPRLTGRPATPLCEWLSTHAGAFRPEEYRAA